jgi:hypothetical protein
MRPENIANGKFSRNRKRAPQATSNSRNNDDPGELTKYLDQEIERRLREVSDELKKLVRSETRSQTERLAKKKLEGGVTEEDRAILELRLRREMEARLVNIAKERSSLDPNIVLRRFTERTMELLSKIDPSGPSEQINSILRQAVLDALRNRKQHLSHLTKLERVIREGSSDQLPQLLDEFFIESGVRRISNPLEGPEFFKAINDPKGKPYIQMVEPAYVDEITGQIIRAGLLRHTAEPQINDEGGE